MTVVTYLKKLFLSFCNYAYLPSTTVLVTSLLLLFLIHHYHSYQFSYVVPLTIHLIIPRFPMHLYLLTTINSLTTFTLLECRYLFPLTVLLTLKLPLFLFLIYFFLTSDFPIHSSFYSPFLRHHRSRQVVLRIMLHSILLSSV